MNGVTIREKLHDYWQTLPPVRGLKKPQLFPLKPMDKSHLFSGGDTVQALVYVVFASAVLGPRICNGMVQASKMFRFTNTDVVTAEMLNTMPTFIQETLSKSLYIFRLASDSTLKNLNSHYISHFPYAVLRNGAGRGTSGELGELTHILVRALYRHCSKRHDIYKELTTNLSLAMITPILLDNDPIVPSKLHEMRMEAAELERAAALKVVAPAANFSLPSLNLRSALSDDANAFDGKFGVGSAAALRAFFGEEVEITSIKAFGKMRIKLRNSVRDANDSICSGESVKLFSDRYDVAQVLGHLHIGYKENSLSKKRVVTCVHRYSKVADSQICTNSFCSSCRILRPEFPHLRKETKVSFIPSWIIERRIAVFPDFFHPQFFFHARIFEWVLHQPGEEAGKEIYPAVDPLAE